MSGKIEVTVLKAVGLRKADLLGKSDPYVKLAIGIKKNLKKGKIKIEPREKEIKTKIVKSSLDPAWKNQKFEFEVKDAKEEFLMFKVWDWNRIRSSDLLGTHDPLPLSRLPKDYPLVWEFPLEPKGSLELMVKAIGFGTNPKEYKISVMETVDDVKKLGKVLKKKKK